MKIMRSFDDGCVEDYFLAWWKLLADFVVHYEFLVSLPPACTFGIK